MVAKYLNIRFSNNSDLAVWLKKMTAKKIHLAESAGDMQTIWVHKSGEILFTDFHSKIYCGKFVDMKHLNQGAPISICDSGSNNYTVYGGLVVESVEAGNNTKRTLVKAN